MHLDIELDEPHGEDVQPVIRGHLAFAREVTPPGHVHALDIDDLCDPSVTFFSARADGVVVGVAALKELDETHGELKSMHTAEGARGRGVARTILAHVLSVAARRGYSRVSLETGTGPAFAPARSLYRDAGFEPCEPFGAYTVNPHSTCMTIVIA